MCSYRTSWKPKCICGPASYDKNIHMVLIIMSLWVTFCEMSLKNLQNLRRRAILHAISALKWIRKFLIPLLSNVDWQHMRKYNVPFQASFRQPTLPQEVALCIITLLTFADTVCILLSNTHSGPCFSVGTLCIAGSVPWFINRRPTDSGSDKTAGVHSAQYKDGGGSCWIKCFEVLWIQCITVSYFRRWKASPFFFFFSFSFAGKHPQVA